MLNTTVPATSNDVQRRSKSSKRPGSESVSVRWWRREASAAGGASAATQWEDLTATSASSVPALAMHTMTVVEGATTYMVIFGGLKAQQQASSGLYILGLDAAGAVWVDKSGLPAAPTPRFGHGAAALDGSLYVYGGWAQVGGTPDGGLYVLDVAKAAWKALTNLPGKPTYGRALFTMVAVSQFWRLCVCVCVCALVCICLASLSMAGPCLLWLR
jgi:hypothetical protein